jgi:epimerase transport system membrane fusion protein
MAGQRREFQARRKATQGDVDVLRQRIEQIGEQIVGFEAMVESKTKRIALYQEEIGGLKELFTKGMGDKSRLREWERLVAELDGERAERQASIATAKVQIGEAQLQITQVKRRFASEVAEQLRDVQTKLADYRERMRALEKTVERTRVVAPVGGYVVGMKFHTLGGVIRPGDPLLDIIPQDESLIVEAHVRPADIDRIFPGLEAQIRFSAFNTRTTPTVPGRVMTISADRLVDQATGMPYYLARIQVTPGGEASLKGLTLLPGMPADVLIKLGERTFFEYLIRPLTDRVSRAFKEE